MICPRCDFNISANLSVKEYYYCTCGTALYSQNDNNCYFATFSVNGITINVWYDNLIIRNYSIYDRSDYFTPKNFLSLEEFSRIFDWKNLDKLLFKVNMARVFK